MAGRLAGLCAFELIPMGSQWVERGVVAIRLTAFVGWPARYTDSPCRLINGRLGGSLLG